MAAEIRQFTVLVPANTLASAPISQPTRFPARVVEAVEIVVPPGPNGNVGFRLENSGIPVIPYDSDAWVITNDEKIVWPLSGYITSGSWGVRAYNTGTQDHVIYLRFLLNIPPSNTPAIGTVALISADSLNPPADSGGADVSIIDSYASGSQLG
jgi:hypothetical protein